MYATHAHLVRGTCEYDPTTDFVTTGVSRKILPKSEDRALAITTMDARTKSSKAVTHLRNDKTIFGKSRTVFPFFSLYFF